MAQEFDSPLGKATTYASQYDPALLFPIARAESRQRIGLAAALPFVGVDVWTAYELSWLNSDGVPQVAVAEFSFPCDSANIVESKSFKLYLNSFNQTCVASWAEVEQRLAADLTAVAGAAVDVLLLSPQEYGGLRNLALPQGICIDQQPVVITDYQYRPDYLAAEGAEVSETLYSQLLRTNCPVTGQPDWATIAITYTGPQLDRDRLLQYLVSFREVQDFHEQCVETIFCDIQARCKPQQLTVHARYTRRGGLDINPWRSTHQAAPLMTRDLRQ